MTETMFATVPLPNQCRWYVQTTDGITSVETGSMWRAQEIANKWTADGDTCRIVHYCGESGQQQTLIYYSWGADAEPVLLGGDA